MDGLRGLAAVAVVVLHVWMYTDANFPKPRRTDLLDRAIGELRIAVVLTWVLPLTSVVATASWFLIEKPAIAPSGRALSRPPAREPLPAKS